MRILVMFDLPTYTVSQRRAYTQFRKHLIKSGFFMLQESIYCKIVLNKTGADNVLDNLRRNKPESGLVQVLTVTEKQFAKSVVLVGKNKTEVINDDRRLVIL